MNFGPTVLAVQGWRLTKGHPASKLLALALVAAEVSALRSKVVLA
jgi:hypothetical protein